MSPEWGIRQERWASHLWTKKRNAALGHVVLPMGLVYLPIRYTSWTRKLDHTLGIWIIDFDDEWVTYIRWMCGFTQTKLLLTLNPIHQKSVYIFICIYDTDIRISIITYNIFQYYIYIYINIYLHFSQCFDFIILYMLWICSRTRTHDSSSRKAILIWLSSSSWFHGSMVLGCFPRDSCEFHVLEPTVLVSLSAAMHPRKGKLKVTF